MMKNNKRLSRLGLGTVQFGMDYGINNTTGKVPPDTAREIITAAIQSGVAFIDTARSYGEAERIIGDTIETVDCKDRVTVCTKLDLPVNCAQMTEAEVVSATAASLSKSLSELKTDTLDVLLLHWAFHRTVHNGAVWKHLAGEKERGRIGSLGVSIDHTPAQALESLADPAVDIIQIPFNVFDSRWERSGVLDRAEERGVAVIGRSAFLQGLLLMDTKTVTSRLPRAACHHAAWIELCADTGNEPHSLALRYALSESRISSTIIGVDSDSQLKANIAAAEAGPLETVLFNMIHDRFSDIPDEVVIPALWAAP